MDPTPDSDPYPQHWYCRRPERAGCAPDVRVVEVGHCYLVRVQKHTTRRYYRARVISLSAHLANIRLLDTGEVSGKIKHLKLNPCLMLWFYQFSSHVEPLFRRIRIRPSKSKKVPVRFCELSSQ
jgi:hypothetical protein